MKNLEGYLELPFENIEASKERICLFFENHEKSLIYWNSKGLPFGALEAPTTSAVTALRANIGDTSTSISRQKSITFTADECIDLFVAFAKDNEASVRDKFKKVSATYLEFYPNGMKPFNSISKKTVNAIMDQFLAAFKNHQTELGVAKYEDLKKICDNYIIARSSQESKKTETKDKRSSWDDCLEAMKDQAFINLLVIAKEYRGQPEKIKLFFDQSIITPKNHSDKADDTIVNDTVK